MIKTLITGKIYDPKLQGNLGTGHFSVSFTSVHYYPLLSKWCIQTQQRVEIK